MAPKGGWETSRFDEMAVNVRDSIDDPSKADVKRYVGLEHLDPDSLTIRRWGLPSDVEAMKLRFRRGDIIFGRRRVYQRKLAVANFDGICSAHAMVLRAKTKTVLPQFLPFFMQSDLFMERAREISVGSLSPTINWKALARQEFALPPLEEQWRIAEVLQARQTASESFFNLVMKTQQLREALVRRLLTKGMGHFKFKQTEIGEIPEEWEVAQLGNILLLCQYGLSLPLNESGKFPIFRMNNFDKGLVVSNDLKFVDIESDLFAQFKLEKGDLLFNRTNSHELVGKTGIFLLEGAFTFASYLIRLRVNKQQADPMFVNYFLNREDSQHRLRSLATRGVSQTNINATNLKAFSVPLPPLPEQRQIVSLISTIDERVTAENQHLVRLSQLRRTLNQLLLSGKVR